MPGDLTEARAALLRQPSEADWIAFFDEADLVNGTSGNTIDDMRRAFEAGWRAALRAHDAAQAERVQP